MAQCQGQASDPGPLALTMLLKHFSVPSPLEGRSIKIKHFQEPAVQNHNLMVMIVALQTHGMSQKCHELLDANIRREKYSKQSTWQKKGDGYVKNFKASFLKEQSFLQIGLQTLARKVLLSRSKRKGHVSSPPSVQFYRQTKHDFQILPTAPSQPRLCLCAHVVPWQRS